MDIVKDKGMAKLGKILEVEAQVLTKQLENWEQFVNTKPSLKDRMYYTRLQDIFEHMSNKTIYHDKQKLQAYISKANEVVNQSGDQ